MSPKRYEYLSYVIPATGEVKQVRHETSPELKWLQAQVGGLIEQVPYWTSYDGRKRGTAYVNEEGNVLHLPYNPAATIAWAADWPPASSLRGTAVITFRVKVD